MIALLLSLAAVFVILLSAELLWQNKKLSGEPGRKFVHISVGTFVAFWPFYMSFGYIQLAALGFIAVVLASRYLNVFRVVHAIDRHSWGDVLFALGIGIAATFAARELIFTAAILHLSLADGFAAIIGKSYSLKNTYSVLGSQKSIAGTIAFGLVSAAIIAAIMLAGQMPAGLIIAYAVILPLAAMAAENVGTHGLDNIFVPVLVIVALNQLQLAL